MVKDGRPDAYTAQSEGKGSVTQLGMAWRLEFLVDVFG
jgi:hypothetical protein